MRRLRFIIQNGKIDSEGHHLSLDADDMVKDVEPIGAQVPMPGDVSRAHHGVRFLDARPECTRHLLEVLRQPPEDGVTELQARGRAEHQYFCGLHGTAADLWSPSRVQVSSTPAVTIPTAKMFRLAQLASAAASCFSLDTWRRLQ
jgi:Magnesium chelatase, subunit ChlI